MPFARSVRRCTGWSASRRWLIATGQHVAALSAAGHLSSAEISSGVWSAAIEARGGLLYAGTIVHAVEERDDGSVVVNDRSRQHHGEAAAVVATNSPIVIPSRFTPRWRRIAPMRWRFRIKRGALPDALYWDTLDPYHYVRLQPGDGRTDYVIVGGADHKSGEADDADVRFEALEAWARNLIPALGEVSHRWSGQVLDTIDYAGFIGRNPGHREHLRSHRRFRPGHDPRRRRQSDQLVLDPGRRSRNGIDVYEPSRKTPSAIGNFLRENTTAREEFRRVSGARGIVVARRSEARPRRHRASRACRRSRPIATMVARCTRARPPARISAVICTGIHSSAAGTARATALISPSMAPR